MRLERFRTEVGADEHGLFVTVTHLPTSRSRTDRPDPAGGVHQSIWRLQAALLVSIGVPGDFVQTTGRCERAGQVGTSYGVGHTPTGRWKFTNSVTEPDTQRCHERLLDALIAELWCEGLLTEATGGEV